MSSIPSACPQGSSKVQPSSPPAQQILLSESEMRQIHQPILLQESQAPGTPVKGAVPGGNPDRYTDLKTEERLIQFIRKGDQGAWMALYDAYKPITAYQINFFKSQIKPHQKEDLMDAGLSGLAFAIEDAKNPEIFDFPKERFIKLAAYHVSKAMREHLGIGEKAFSLDAPIDGSSKTNNNGSSFQDFLSETTDTEAEASEKEKKTESYSNLSTSLKLYGRGCFDFSLWAS
ncbi:MAG: hypothetical protein K2X66_17515 [Cyanobacteria bacterium]|nr:hypothetical protein [Cyanobacteriota bacterium]